MGEARKCEICGSLTEKSYSMTDINATIAGDKMYAIIGNGLRVPLDVCAYCAARCLILALTELVRILNTEGGKF